jgi:hypothetical protein
MSRTVYPNWRKADDAHIQKHAATIFPMAVNEWVVYYDKFHQSFRISRPEPMDKQANHFARKWGLFANGRPTAKAKQYAGEKQYDIEAGMKDEDLPF